MRFIPVLGPVLASAFKVILYTSHRNQKLAELLYWAFGTYLELYNGLNNTFEL